MEESLEDFEIKDTTCPKKGKDIKKKPPMKLSTNKNIRRSAMYDKLPPSLKIEKIAVVDATSTGSSESSSLSDSAKKLIEKYRERQEISHVVIESTEEEEEIIETDSETQQVKKPIRLSPKNIHQAAKNDHLSETKFESIKNWIEGINSEPTQKDVSLASVAISEEVITSKNVNIKPRNKKYETPRKTSSKKTINSTFSLDNTCIPFDKWMKNVCRSESKAKSKTPSVKSMENDTNKENERKDDNVPETPKQDIADLLDNLYGNSWHKNRDQIFSEPRKQPKQKPQLDKLKRTQTERKRADSPMYPNPYMYSEREKSTNLLKDLQKKRIEANLESPFFKRPECVYDDFSPANLKSWGIDDKLKKLIDDLEDSDAKSEKKSGKELNVDLKKDLLPKPTKLKFNNENDELKTPKTDQKPKYKQIFDLSDETDSDFEQKPTDLGPKRPTRKCAAEKPQYEEDLIDKLVNTTIHDSDSDDFVQKAAKPLGFLASLSKHVPVEKCDPSALIYKNKFAKHRDALTKKLFDMFNEKIFQKCLPDTTPIEWSSRMTGTAGFCVCTKRTHSNGTQTRFARLQLSTKVLDSADRLRDTLVHEMCHAATFIVNQVVDGHGPQWKAWADLAMRTFPELPAIKRCHDYDINYKYTYRCMVCKYSFGRHTKSLNLEAKRCGHCYGKFEVLLNKVGQGGDKKSVPCTPKKKATGFALFVKENYALYKSPGVKHADLMKMLGKKFQKAKVVKKT